MKKSVMNLSLFITIFSLLSLSSSSSSSLTTPISYSDHCSSIVHESAPTVPDYTTLASLQETTVYYTGGERILGGESPSWSFDSEYYKYLSFRTTRRSTFKTTHPGVYQIEAFVIFRSSSNAYYVSDNSTFGGNRTRFRRPSSLRFIMNGFWSESSQRLCMVGSAKWFSTEGKTLHLEAVLKLNYANQLTIFNSLFNGTLESLSPSDDLNFFDPISMLGYSTSNNYKYTLVSEELGGGCSGGIDFPPKLSLSLEDRSVCSLFWNRFESFELEYKSGCDSAKNCAPFGDDIDVLPLLMSINTIECSDYEQKLRYLIDFSNINQNGYYANFYPNVTLIGEGSWDGKKNRLCISACRILNLTDSSWRNARVGDCSVRLSLSFTKIWSIRNTSTVVGQIWTNKPMNDSGYFERITFQSSANRMVNGTGLKYEYTETNRVRMSCPMKKPQKNKKANYPDGYSNDMRFDMSVTDSTGNSSWGYAVPISMEDRFFEEYPMIISDSWTPQASSMDGYTVAFSPVSEPKIGHADPMNISYKLNFNPIAYIQTNMSSRPFGPVEIFAEGIYDPQTGHLCMVGCRKLSSSIRKSKVDDMDCEIRVNFHFPQINSKSGGVIKGSIESTRKRSDSLYFNHFNMSSTAFYTQEAKESIWRMDLEIIMVLISSTLACVFVALQIFYVKKNPIVLPFNSIFMLVILTLGHMVPLLLNFEAMFLGNRNQQEVLIGSGGWLEVNEVIMRVVTMVAFLLQIRLLQLAWPSRLAEEYPKGLWASEIKAMFVSIPSYIAGGLIALFVNSKKNSIGYQQHSLWGDLKSYGGLVLDGFLFPQILLNIFQSSRERALSHPFYIGTTSVRVLPHAYDLYRTQNYVPQHFNGSYIYANPTADFYSTAWDVIIPLGGLLFAVIIFLQQRFGGRVIVPRKFRELVEYEKVPVVSS